MTVDSSPRAQLLERARALDFQPAPCCDGNGARAATEQGWRAATEHASDTGLLQLSRQLDLAEEAVRRSADIQARWAEDDARRARSEQPLPEDDPSLVAMRAAAAELDEKLRYRASTEGRLEAVEGLLVEIRDALKGGR